MAKGVQLAELPAKVRKTLEPKNKVVPEKLIAFGRVLQVLEGMQRREAL